MDTKRDWLAINIATKPRSAFKSLFLGWLSGFKVCLWYNIIVFEIETQLPRKVFMKYKILTENVVDLCTGEISTKDFKEIIPRSKLKGGFTIMYKKLYNDALIGVIRSKKDVALFLHIQGLFSKNKIEVPLNSRNIAKDVSSQLGEKLTSSKVTEVKNRMIEVDMLMRVSRGLYRLNPFAFIPYQSDGVVLQKEWKKIKEKSK